MFSSKQSPVASIADLFGFSVGREAVGTKTTGGNDSVDNTGQLTTVTHCAAALTRHGDDMIYVNVEAALLLLLLIR